MRTKQRQYNKAKTSGKPEDWAKFKATRTAIKKTIECTEFAVSGNVIHHVYMSVRGRIPTCVLIGRLFLGSGLKINTFFANSDTNTKLF
jgi:hypothetical protein